MPHKRKKRGTRVENAAVRIESGLHRFAVEKAVIPITAPTRGTADIIRPILVPKKNQPVKYVVI